MHARSGPSACVQSVAVTAESIPPDTATTAFGEAVLLDVVLEPEDESATHLLERRLERFHDRR